MKVDVLAYTKLNAAPLIRDFGYRPYTVDDDGMTSTDADTLGEAAGRICYKSFARPNPATATNAGYMSNILAQGHYSVLEHASVSFLVQDVSRALLTELTRHRHLSFSVVSQRYVNYADTKPVVPPAVAEVPGMAEHLGREYERALKAYADYVETLTAHGMKRKQAREAARSVLPNAAPVDMVVTGNLRAWRDVLGKRWHVAADVEIREFARRVLVLLQSVAPNSVQDVPTSPYGSDEK